MTSCVTYNPITVADSAIAYLLTVTSATLVIIVMMSLKSPMPFSGALFIFIASWLFIFCLALIPYVTAIAIANRYKISHWSYFIGGGILTASILCFALIAIPELGINVVVPEPSYWEKYSSAMAFVAPCGAISGAICWWSLCYGEPNV
jgi:hypothetical protein